ncbi:MAG TPA: ATP-binding cassette domain-containing protein, partial [Thermoplasmata archaeon]|nr:ATP-binding cassette domain-containing protein [Thermoplasmata archaeon]
RRAAYVPAGLGLFPHRSARENVAYAGRFAEMPDPARLDRLLDRFGIRPFESRRPATLSDGERERVAAARALLSDPELLLWDEPLTALDQEARRDLLQALLDVARIDRVPTIVVSHDPEIAFTLADRFLLLDEGTPRFYGRPEEFLEHPPDAFSARFAGYENVWSRDDLAAAAASEPSVRPWLARAGLGGLCFDAPLLSGPPRSADGLRATVRRIVPRVPGFRIEATIGRLELRLAAPRGCGRSGFPRPGDAVPFDLPDDGVRAIGGAGEAA